MNANYVNYLKADKKSVRTINEYTKYVNQMLNYISKEEDKITLMDLENWQASISHLSSSSVRIQISAVTSYFKFLKKNGIVESNIALELEKPRLKNKEKIYPEDSDSMKEIIQKFVDNTRTDRDRAILLLFASNGLRVSELINITLSEYKDMREKGERKIIITGKGDKKRPVFFNDETKLAIDLYLISRPKTDCDNLFLSYWGGPINSNNLSQTIKNIAKRAGISCWKDISNHYLRMAAATRYAEEGYSIEDIRDLLGHESTDTTSKYIKSNQKRIKNMVMGNNFMANNAF